MDLDRLSLDLGDHVHGPAAMAWAAAAVYRHVIGKQLLEYGDDSILLHDVLFTVSLQAAMS